MNRDSKNISKQKKAADFLGDESDSDDTNELKLSINKKFAQNYEDRKRRQELGRAKEMGIDLSDTTSEEEDEGDALTFAKDAQIMNVLQMIKNKDPKIYDKDTELYTPTNEDEEMKPSEKKESKMTLKDALREQVLKGDIHSDEEDDSDLKKVKTYNDEMEELRKNLIDAGKTDNDEDENSDDEFFNVRSHTESETPKTLKDYVAKHYDADKNASLLDFVSKEPENEKDKFLFDYMNKREWKDDSEDDIPTYKDIIESEDNETKDVDLDEDMQELEQADRFESSYNFRYEDIEEEEEENKVDTNIQSFPRNIDGSIRRKDTKRKKERQERKIRQESELYRKREELKRLKKLREQEIEKKLKEIETIAGKDVDIDIDSDFDPEKYDKQMESIYNDDYYNQEELEKPDVDLSDELSENELNVYIDKEVEEERNEKTDTTEEKEDENIIPETDTEKEKIDQEKQELLKQKQQEIDDLYDELYKLDYEDVVAGQQVRFPYKQVPARDYGLTTEEILAADDKELRGYISVKKMTPYQEKEYKVRKDLTKRFKKDLHERIEEQEAKRKARKEESIKNKKIEKKKAKESKQKKHRLRNKKGDKNKKTKKINKDKKE